MPCVQGWGLCKLPRKQSKEKWLVLLGTMTCRTSASARGKPGTGHVGRQSHKKDRARQK